MSKSNDYPRKVTIELIQHDAKGTMTLKVSLSPKVKQEELDQHAVYRLAMMAINELGKYVEVEDDA